MSVKTTLTSVMEASVQTSQENTGVSAMMDSWHLKT